MKLTIKSGRALAAVAVALLPLAWAATAHSSHAGTRSSSPGALAQSAKMSQSTSAAPPASQTGGFDGAKAYAQTAKLVSFGPRPPATDAIRRTQDYIIAQLKSFGCAVDTDEFHAQTPSGTVAMKNIVAKIPGTERGIILLMTHYDTLRLADFVGAEDGGSSTGLMLEMARVLCGRKPEANAIWIAFFDGEEAQVVENGQPQWNNDLSDSVYGSREMAAQMAVSGDLKRIHAAILADMIGQYNLQIARDNSSTTWLTNLVWKTAANLGYGKIFVPQETSVEDDHSPFIKRGVPAVDIIDLNGYPYWHTTQDTMDKVSAVSLAVVGHVILETVNELQRLKP